MSTILPDFTDTSFAEHVKDPKLQEQLRAAREKFAMSPHAVASAIAYIIDHPENLNIGEVTLRSKAQP